MPEPKRDSRLINRVIDGEATKDETKQLQARLKSDPQAKRELEDLRKVDQATRAIPPAAPPSNFRDRVMKGIRRDGR